MNLSDFSPLLALTSVKAPVAKPSSANVSLETIPSSGIISQYGVCGGEYELDSYSQNYLQKLEHHLGTKLNGGSDDR